MDNLPPGYSEIYPEKPDIGLPNLHLSASADYYEGSADAFSFILQQLNLLLKDDESKQPQPPDFANTMLGEVPHVVNAQSEDTTQAVEGATPVVRQNEQTKEVCPLCSGSGNYIHSIDVAKYYSEDE